MKRRKRPVMVCRSCRTFWQITRRRKCSRGHKLVATTIYNGKCEDD